MRVISNFGVGVDHIDVAAAATRGIPVGNTPGVLDGATADMAFALLLAAGRRLVEGDRYARGPEFLRYDPSYMLGREMHGTTLGIIGMGRIGTQVARRARGLRHDGAVPQSPAAGPTSSRRPGRRSTSPRTSCCRARITSCSPCRSRAETRHLIGRAELAQMKPTGMLINVARGAVVDTAALTEALAARTIYAAALDVTDPEPLPRDHPLLGLDNVIIAPHLGSATDQTRQRMAEMSIENLLAGLAGRRCRFWCP